MRIFLHFFAEIYGNFHFITEINNSAHFWGIFFWRKLKTE